MSVAHGPGGVDRALWDELLAALEAALHEGRRRPLSRLAERAELDATEAVRELATFPAAACAAVAPGVGLAPARCEADRGCPVVGECRLQRGGAPHTLAASAVGQLVIRLAACWRRPMPPAPAPFADWPAIVERLLIQSGRLRPGAPPRVWTAREVLEQALSRGGPLGATGPFLTGREVDQVAAFVPPGSGSGERLLVEVEAWLRRAASVDVALVEPRGELARGRRTWRPRRA